MKVDESNYETLKKVSDLTLTDYEIRWFDAENIDGYIDSYTLFSMVEDLLLEIDRLEERYEDLENDLESNYKPLTNKELYGDIEII